MINCFMTTNYLGTKEIFLETYPFPVLNLTKYIPGTFPVKSTLLFELPLAWRNGSTVFPSKLKTATSLMFDFLSGFHGKC